MPKEKRLFGYFALPVLVGDEIVAAIDLKTDRSRRKLLMQQWSWVGGGARKDSSAGSSRNCTGSNVFSSRTDRGRGQSGKASGGASLGASRIHDH